ncbi:ATP-dependent microtubule motor [Aureococcus anophagefferens]|nr:ATP-dependent microtubule motor [Aureococcus anophagefferens]
MPRCVDDVFARVAALGAGREARVTCTYLEIYNEQVRDLFGDDVEKQLQVRTARDGSTLVAGLTEIPLESAQDARDCLAVGAERRQSAATSMNDQSSRSHAVFELKVAVREGGSATTRVGRFLLVDLAGSESAGRTGIEGAGGARRLEAQSINQSLLALGQVITALSGGEKHVPFRDSKLTRLLQDSLGGSAATVLVACVGPSPKSRDESLSTLRYADRAGRIDNVAAHRVHVAPPRAPDAETLAKLERDLAAAELRVADADATARATPERRATSPASARATP